jgi:hypothetical protein
LTLSFLFAIAEDSGHAPAAAPGNLQKRMQDMPEWTLCAD